MKLRPDRDVLATLHFVAQIAFESPHRCAMLKRVVAAQAEFLVEGKAEQPLTFRPDITSVESREVCDCPCHC